MFKKIFEYAGPYKKNMYVATVVVLVSVLMGVLPFVLAYQPLAKMLKTNIESFSNLKVHLGELDITLYRDDLSEKYSSPQLLSLIHI